MTTPVARDVIKRYAPARVVGRVSLDILQGPPKRPSKYMGKTTLKGRFGKDLVVLLSRMKKAALFRGRVDLLGEVVWSKGGSDRTSDYSVRCHHTKDYTTDCCGRRTTMVPPRQHIQSTTTTSDGGGAIEIPTRGKPRRRHQRTLERVRRLSSRSSATSRFPSTALRRHRPRLPSAPTR